MNRNARGKLAPKDMNNTRGGKRSAESKNSKKGLFGNKRKTVDDELENFHLFVKMFGFLIRDGYNPNKAMELLITSAKGQLGISARSALEHIKQGAKISAALTDTGYFPKEFCAVVGVGESTGSLGESLELYSEYIEKVLQMRKGFKSALMYPTILLAFIIVMAGVVLLFVTPKFVEMLNSMGAKREALPGISMVLFYAHDFVNLVGTPVVIAFIAFAAYYLVVGNGKNRIIKMLGVVPKIHDVNNKLNWAQWLMMGAICVKSGMLLNNMLTVLSGLPLPDELKKRKNKKSPTNYEIIKSNVAIGKSLSAQLSDAEVPDIIAQVTGAAEKSGRLGEAMQSVANQYLYSLPMDIKGIGTVVEQMIIAIVVLLGGGMISVVAITMMSMSSLQ